MIYAIQNGLPSGETFVTASASWDADPIEVCGPLHYSEVAKLMTSDELRFAGSFNFGANDWDQWGAPMATYDDDTGELWFDESDKADWAARLEEMAAWRQ